MKTDTEALFEEKFNETVLYIFKNHIELVTEYDRLNNTNIASKRASSPIENLVDRATGIKDKELLGFFDFVMEFIFIPSFGAPLHK